MTNIIIIKLLIYIYELPYSFELLFLRNPKVFLCEEFFNSALAICVITHADRNRSAHIFRPQHYGFQEREMSPCLREISIQLTRVSLCELPYIK